MERKDLADIFLEVSATNLGFLMVSCWLARIKICISFREFKEGVELDLINSNKCYLYQKTKIDALANSPRMDDIKHFSVCFPD